ncbi:porin family protein [Mucilaginibacter flavus]|uniref:porin family protein n=1 Tax=Mucilaginibacter flavus TaxID=931504 RepID=UPI0025B62754|nr:porin family protein [Mucilaginibacter flavus]MDN3584160.1 porin family protein [Mucilaginibacter flavus]
MKKFLLIIVLSGFVTGALAQSMKFTIVAGVNSSTASNIPDDFIKRVAIAGETFPNSKLIGFNAGVLAAYPVGKIAIQAGLLYTTKGGVPYSFSTGSNANNSLSRKDVLRLNYLEMPLNVIYNLPVGPGKFFLGGGPYVGIGISGKASYNIKEGPGETSTNQTTKDSKSVTYGSGYDDLKATDVGLGAKLGFALNKGWLISFNYEQGLTNLSNDPRYNGKNKTLSLSLGYSF